MELGPTPGKQPSVAHAFGKYFSAYLGNACLSMLRILESYGANPKQEWFIKKRFCNPLPVSGKNALTSDRPRRPSSSTLSVPARQPKVCCPTHSVHGKLDLIEVHDRGKGPSRPSRSAWETKANVTIYNDASATGRTTGRGRCHGSCRRRSSDHTSS